jgi:hypothetical protein
MQPPQCERYLAHDAVRHSQRHLYYICVFILLYVSLYYVILLVSSYCYIFVLIILHLLALALEDEEVVA